MNPAPSADPFPSEIELQNINPNRSVVSLESENSPASEGSISGPSLANQPPDDSTHFTKQSLRGTILTWTRWTFSQTLFQMPFYFRSLGVSLTLAVFGFNYLVSYHSYAFLFNASEATDSNFYPEIVERVLGRRMGQFFRLTYFYDITSSYLLAILSSWQFFESILRGLGLVGRDWVVSEDLSELDQYHPHVFLVRMAFFILLFATSLPFLLKRHIKDFSDILKHYLNALILLAVLLLLQMPFYSAKYRAEDTLDVTLGVSVPSFDWSEGFFNMLYIFYLQPYVLNLKAEMRKPTLPRLRTVTIVSSVIQVSVNAAFGLLVYLSLGNRFTPYYLLDKKPLDRWYLEQLQTAATLILFVTNNYSNPMFNPIYRPVIADLLGIRDHQDQHHVSLSILPFLIMCLCGIFIPGLYRFVYWIGTPVYCFNGYIVPALLEWTAVRRLGKRWGRLLGVSAFILFFLAAAVVGEVICLSRLNE